LTTHYHVGAVGFDISFPEPDTSSGYGVLEKLANGELKDVPALRQRLETLKPSMDYDGLFAAALTGNRSSSASTCRRTRSRARCRSRCSPKRI
jgi:adenylate cyclase